MFKDFKEFALRGNMLEMAIGVVIGGAFGKIVTSLVNDMIMPPIGLLVGKVDFSHNFLNLTTSRYATLQQAKAAGAPTLNYGAFITTVLDLFNVAFAVFIVGE